MRTIVSVVLFMVGGACVPCEARPIRLFLSTVGLSNPSDPQSDALMPVADFGINPHVLAGTTPDTRVRFYVWTRLEPPGTPNNVFYNGVSLRATVTGGGVMSAFNFWNYTNGDYGGSGRWQTFSQSGDATSAIFSGAAINTGAGVNNTNAAAASDRHHFRFAPDGVTRADVTLLGWIEIASNGNFGQIASIYLEEGPLGISQSGQPPQPVYFGWGDEPPGEPILPEATVMFVPEPSPLVALAFLMLGSRRC